MAWLARLRPPLFLTRPLMAILASALAGSLLILAAGVNPLEAYASLLRAGYGCEGGVASRCALLTAFQFGVPLMLTGLAATVSLRAGFFSLGQPGQMLFGAAVACWVGSRFDLPPIIHPIAAMAGGMLFGALFAWIPAVLRERVGVNEIISTLLLNPVAGFLAGFFWSGRIEDTAMLPPLVPTTKLSAGVFIALLAALGTWVYLWRTSHGYENRMAGQAPRFASFGGIMPHRAVVQAVMISGALAGLAGALEVLGVHYQLVTSFSAVDSFDGLIVAFVGQLHPLGVAIMAVVLGGLRAGALVGLQIESHVPRELGGALIALLLIFAARGGSPQPEAGE